MNKLIKMRVSRRNFTNKKIPNQKSEKIMAMVKQINQKSKLSIEFLEDGSKAFQNLTKSYGIFKNVRSMLLMKGNQTDPNLKEKIGYYGEELMLNIVGLGLGTCWVGGTYEKQQFTIKDNEELICVIVIGEIDTSLKDTILRKVITRKRKEIQERIITDTKLPQWIEIGLEAVKLAPSARNTQKVMFRYENSELTAQIADDYYFDLVDLGIAKKHFELESNGNFEMGNGGKFRKYDIQNQRKKGE